MPNRILKESICSSDDIDRLSAFEETVFYRLIVRADDYGRLDARPGFLKSMLFVTKPGVTEKSVQDAVSKLASVGLVRLYEVDGKPFLLFPKWNLHQRIRSSKEKYPAPEQNDDFAALPQPAAICGDSPQIAVLIQSNPNPIQSESNPNPERNPNPNYCAEQGSASSTPLPPPAIYLPLNDKTEYAVSQKQIDEWSELYPAVDVMQQLRNMKGWLNSNPKKRKTRSGIERFITGWLASEQNKGGGKNHSSSAATDTDNIFLQMMDEERKQ